MKTIYLFLLLIPVFFMGCEQVPGPPGPPGEDGLLGTVFEIQGDFTPQNDYTLFYEFPSNFEVYDGDIVLVYILWEISGNNDIWRLLPQTVVLNDGVLQYNFDYTLNDVQVFLEGTTNFSNLLPAETQDQIFRIAVIPAAIAKNATFDFSDLNVVMKSLNIGTKDVNEIRIQK